MELHLQILINFAIPPIKPLPRGRSNIGILSASRRISLIPGDTVSVFNFSYVRWIDSRPSATQVFFLDISRHIRKISLGVCYYDNVSPWRSNDGRVHLHFLTITEVFAHMKKQSRI